MDQPCSCVALLPILSWLMCTCVCTASVGYDRYHPASPSLAAFEGT